ncbi:heme exporter protein CcmD [Achromobacter sp. MFA1 R4]|uniref:heme exporter protein CcmD n=1 Tax=Achromobacter sp. MFA1 R4 TaxID=1881016 RepID=UPI000953967C|nr:heme exporter protein CcmD [Achromobacter sp. MFA1 R4]SIT32848.1 heme exporter protein CcmD [Achromobacter sp. MFA1 R4]
MSWETLFSLQGHGPYILGAYGVTILLMGWEALSLWRRARRARRQRDDSGGLAGRTRP